MQHQLINLNPDLKRLRDEGYEIEIKGGYVCIHHIPYVNSKKQVGYGTLVTDLNLVGPKTLGEPKDHTMYFSGEAPCHKDGTQQDEFINSQQNKSLVNGVIGNYYLSSKPASGKYAGYYEKITRYASLITAPAVSLNPDVTARTYQAISDDDDEGVFNYYDTNSSRANILELNNKFKGQQIGIIGLGGTGAYVLDFVAKTHVEKIRLFDGDRLKVHNAFRAPGAASADDLEEGQYKVDYFSGIYSRMHRGIEPNPVYITENNYELLLGLSFVFICVDKDSVRHAIVQLLLKLNIPFIDVGLGVTVVDNELTGMIRTTIGTSEKNDHLERRIHAGDADDNEYTTNIQIAELNAGNAFFAVLKWKKIMGFYQDLRHEHHAVYSINVGEINNADFGAPLC
jgi:molybdopterin/thiamine biosynthesis adenylyltransferase